METVTIVASVTERKDLVGTVVKALNTLGDKIGAGYIHAVRVMPNGDRYAAVRVLIGNAIYFGTLNWDKTPQCKISPCPVIEVAQLSSF